MWELFPFLGIWQDRLMASSPVINRFSFVFPTVSPGHMMFTHKIYVSKEQSYKELVIWFSYATAEIIKCERKLQIHENWFLFA